MTNVKKESMITNPLNVLALIPIIVSSEDDSSSIDGASRSVGTLTGSFVCCDV